MVLLLPGQSDGRLLTVHHRLEAPDRHDIRLVHRGGPGNLEVAITEFVNYYNNRRYHKALGSVTPSDVLDGRREQILQKRKEVQTQTFQRRRRYNQQIRDLAQSARNFH